MTVDWVTCEEIYPNVPENCLVLPIVHITWAPDKRFDYNSATIKSELSEWCDQFLQGHYVLSSQQGYVRSVASSYEGHYLSKTSEFAICRPIMVFQHEVDMVLFRLRWL